MDLLIYALVTLCIFYLGFRAGYREAEKEFLESEEA